MKRTIHISITILITIVLSCSAAHASGLFPKSDQLFGITMPDISFAIGRIEDQSQTVELGEQVFFSGFTPNDYETTGKYFKVEDLELNDYSVSDGMLEIELSKDGASIGFQYNYEKKEAVIFYPEGTRREKKKKEADLSESLFPDLNRIFGTRIPALDSVLTGFHEQIIQQKDGWNEITYDEISTTDYHDINQYLTGVGCVLLDYNSSNGNMQADLEYRGGTFSVRYNLYGKTFTYVCPELYYMETDETVSTTKKGFILPSVSESFGAVLPRVSSAILRLPDQSITTEDGSTIEVYLNFEEEDYTKFSKYLNETHCTVGDYFVDEQGTLVIPLELNGANFVFSYDQLRCLGCVKYLSGAVVEPEISASVVRTPEPTEMPQPEETARPMERHAYSENDCWDTAESYLMNQRWKNPSSVTIHSHTTTKSDNGYTFWIDYSAQNGFGGYNRETYVITVNRYTNKVTLAYKI